MSGLAPHFWAITEDLPLPDGGEAVSFSCTHCWVSIKVERTPRRELPGGRRDPTDEELLKEGVPVGCKERTVRDVMES